MINDDMRVVFESRNRGACSDRALVLAAVQIPHQLVEDASSCALIVPAKYSARAMDELLQYDEENPPSFPKPIPKIVYQDARPGILVYIIIVSLVAGLQSRSSFAIDWLAAGRVDGVLMRGGEWWRAITALTLHSGLRHLAGNILFGALFGLFAGRLLGSGVAWLWILIAGSAGNILNTLFLESSHRSVGASTAVFAALGLVAGFVWRGKFMAQERWSYRLGPIVGGFALLMYTGTGGPRTDVGAHLMGFLAGLVAGIFLTRFRPRLSDPRWQNNSAALALALLAGAWCAALLV